MEFHESRRDGVGHNEWDGFTTNRSHAQRSRWRPQLRSRGWNGGFVRLKRTRNQSERTIQRRTALSRWIADSTRQRYSWGTRETAYVGRRTKGSTNSSSGIKVNAASVDRLCGTARWRRVTAMLKVSPRANSTELDTPIRSRPSIVVGREQRDGSNTQGMRRMLHRIHASLQKLRSNPMTSHPTSFATEETLVFNWASFGQFFIGHDRTPRKHKG